MVALNELNLGSKSALILRFCNIKILDEDIKENGKILFCENFISITLIYCTHLGWLPSLQIWWTEFLVHQLMPYYTKILRNQAYQTFEFHSILIKVQFDWSFFVFVHYHGDQLPHCTTTMEKWVAPPRASRMVISWLQVWDAFSKHKRYWEIFFPLHVSRPTKQKLLAMHHIWNTVHLNEIFVNRF